MESLQRRNTTTMRAAKPLQLMHRRSSLPTQMGSPRQREQRFSSVGADFLGFGAAPPRLNFKMKQLSQPLMDQENSLHYVALLSDAERLIQNILQNNTVKISQETISKAMQQSAALHSKKKYSALIEKPWRMTSETLYEDEELDSSNIYARKNPKKFRRSSSSDSVATPPSNDELVNTKKALDQANERIICLQNDLEKYGRTHSSHMPLRDEDDSLSSTNIDDEDEIVGLSTTTSFIPDSNSDSKTPPLDYIKAPSPGHRSRRKSVGSDNVVSRLEYRALQIRNEQLLQRISFLENELSPDFVPGRMNGTVCTSIAEGSAHESEKDAVTEIMSKLSLADQDQSRQVSYMEAKITTLVKQMQQLESKCRCLTENETVAKETIENLSMQLLECEEKAKESNERLIRQGENRIEETNKVIQRMEHELKAKSGEAAAANSARLCAESKCLQLEQMQNKVILSLQNQLNHAESKSQRLQDKVNSLTAKAAEMSVQNEQERTLERCSDLSLQLAESQFKIDQLTEQLRNIQKKELLTVHHQHHPGSTRPPASFQSMLNTGIDRISSRLDDSLRGSNRGKSDNISRSHDSSIPFPPLGTSRPNQYSS